MNSILRIAIDTYYSFRIDGGDILFLGDYLGLSVSGNKAYPCCLDTPSGDPDIFVNIVGWGGCTREPAWLCDGDVDGDGQVNPVDYGIVQSLFGICESPRALCPRCDDRSLPRSCELQPRAPRTAATGAIHRPRRGLFRHVFERTKHVFDLGKHASD